MGLLGESSMGWVAGKGNLPEINWNPGFGEKLLYNWEMQRKPFSSMLDVDNYEFHRVDTIDALWKKQKKALKDGTDEFQLQKTKKITDDEEFYKFLLNHEQNPEQGLLHGIERKVLDDNKKLTINCARQNKYIMKKWREYCMASR